MAVTTLLVDCESPVRDRLVAAISELTGVKVDTLDPDRPDLVDEVRRRQPDVVLVAVDRCKGRGLAIIEKVRRRGDARFPIVIALANSKSLQYRASAHEAGALYFFNHVREEDWLLDALASIQDQIGPGEDQVFQGEPWAE